MIALFTSKGAISHRKTGIVFVYCMALMGITGAIIAALTGVTTSVIAGLLAVYLVITAFTAVRPQTSLLKKINIAALFIGLSVSTGAFFIGVTSLTDGIFFKEGINQRK